MRIQSSNQNNDSKKNIRFKMNSCVILEGFYCDYSRLEASTKIVLHKAIFQPLLTCGRIKMGKKYKVVQDERELSTFWVINEETMERIKNTTTETEGDNLWQEIINSVRTFKINWTRKQPKIRAN